MMRTMTMVATMTALLGAGIGCKDEPNPCDSTSYYDGTSCMPKKDAAPREDAAPIDATGPALDTAAEEAGGGPPSLLGVSCMTAGTGPECDGPDTDYCAIQSAPPGYCTKSGCSTDADCPPNWTCFDLAKMGVVGYPTMCTKPRS